MSPVQNLLVRLKTGKAPEPSAAPSAAAPAGGDGAPAPSEGPPAGWAYKPGEGPDVLRGRYEFHRAFSSLAKGKRNWQLVAFTSLALLALAVAGLVGLSLQSKTVPYVVEVDRLGRASAIAPAEAVPSVSDRVVVAALSAFVTSIRTVYTDPVAQRDAVVRGYAYVAGDARQFLEDYFSLPENDPRVVAAELRRQVEVVSVLPVPVPDGAPAQPYRVQWHETEVSVRGGTRERAWEGYMTVEVHPPTTTEGIERNPLGVFVTALSWSALAGDVERGGAAPAEAPTASAPADDAPAPPAPE